MVLDELLRLGKGIPGEPQHVLNGIKLSARQYADLCELHGTVKIRGMTMHQKLERLFKSPDYDLERKYKGDSRRNSTRIRAPYEWKRLLIRIGKPPSNICSDAIPISRSNWICSASRNARPERVFSVRITNPQPFKEFKTS